VLHQEQQQDLAQHPATVRLHTEGWLVQVCCSIVSIVFNWGQHLVGQHAQQRDADHALPGAQRLPGRRAGRAHRLRRRQHHLRDRTLGLIHMLLWALVLVGSGLKLGSGLSSHRSGSHQELRSECSINGRA